MNYKLIRFSKLIFFMILVYLILSKTADFKCEDLIKITASISIIYIILDEYYPTVNPESL